MYFFDLGGSIQNKFSAKVGILSQTALPPPPISIPTKDFSRIFLAYNVSQKYQYLVIFDVILVILDVFLFGNGEPLQYCNKIPAT